MMHWSSLESKEIGEALKHWNSSRVENWRTDLNIDNLAVKCSSDISRAHVCPRFLLSPHVQPRQLVATSGRLRAGAVKQSPNHHPDNTLHLVDITRMRSVQLSPWQPVSYYGPLRTARKSKTELSNSDIEIPKYKYLQIKLNKMLPRVKIITN